MQNKLDGSLLQFLQILLLAEYLVRDRTHFTIRKISEQVPATSDELFVAIYELHFHRNVQKEQLWHGIECLIRQLKPRISLEIAATTKFSAQIAI